MQKYINDIIQIGPFLLSGISLVMFLYSCRKSAAPKGIKYFWAGMLLFSLPAMTGKFRTYILPNSAYAPFFNILYVACFVCGVVMVRKGNKMLKEATNQSTEVRKASDISTPVGLIFGLITLAFVPVSFLFAIATFFGLTTGETRQLEWTMIIVSVFFGVLSVFFAVVGWRLINVRKGWTGKLFAPYTLWLKISGWLFLIVGYIKLAQRSLTGILVISIAIALIILANKASNKIAKTN